MQRLLPPPALILTACKRNSQTIFSFPIELMLCSWAGGGGLRFLGYSKLASLKILLLFVVVIIIIVLCEHIYMCVLMCLCVYTPWAHTCHCTDIEVENRFGVFAFHLVESASLLFLLPCVLQAGWPTTSFWVILPAFPLAQVHHP